MGLYTSFTFLHILLLYILHSSNLFYFQYNHFVANNKLTKSTT